MSKKKSDVPLHENIFLENDSVTRSNSGWPTNEKHHLNDFPRVKTRQSLVFAQSQTETSFPLFLSAVTCFSINISHSNSSKTFFFFWRGSKQKLQPDKNLSGLYFPSPSPSLTLADWLLKCGFLPRELQNSARARMMEITFLASLCGATIRPGVYFKCNWVWCIHKGKMLCLWPKWCTLFCLWMRCQTFSTATAPSFPHWPGTGWQRRMIGFVLYLRPSDLPVSLRSSQSHFQALPFGFDVFKWKDLGLHGVRWHLLTASHSTAEFGNTPNSISATASLMTMTTSQSKCRVKLLFVTSS